VIQPEAPVVAPPVVKWYKAYCIASALLFLVYGTLGVFIILAPNYALPGHQKDMPPASQGIMYTILGFTMMIPFIIALFLPRKPWVWIYGIVTMVLGAFGCCCLPASIALLVFWLRPEVKEYFGAA
jgi:hypothetical protein